MRTTTEIQRWLIQQGYLAAVNANGEANDDGRFGTDTLAAYNRARAAKGEGPHTGLLLLVEVNADLFPEEQPKPAPSTPSIFSNLGTLLSIINLLKGKTMTQDQINGIIRTVLAAGLSYLAAKGLIPVVPPDLAAAIGTVLIGVWSLYSNRAKTILSIADKKAMSGS